MSGHKRATVALNQDDFRRLHEAEQRLRTVEQDYHDVRAKVASIHTHELEQSFQQLSERQQRFQQALAGVDDDLSALEWNTSQALIDQLGQVQEQVSAQVNVLSGQLFDDTSALVDASSARLESGLEQLAFQHQDELARLQRSLRHLHRSERERAELAAQSLASAQLLFEALQSEYQLPSEAAVLAQDLANAQANFDNALFEAALVGAQQSVARLSDLRLRLEQDLVVRQQRLADVRLQARALYETGLRSRSVPALDLDGQPLDFAIAVPFWSGGAFQAWLTRCQKLLRQLETPLDLPELDRLQEQVLPELDRDLSEIVYQARLNVIASQVRFNIAACIVQALQEQGFELSQAEYDASDQRAAYQAVVRAFDGSEVLVHVNPVPGDPAATDVDLVSHDRQPRSEHELRQRARELAVTLQASGLQVGKLSVPIQGQSVRERPAPYTASRQTLASPGQGGSAGAPLPASRPAPLRRARTHHR